MGEIRGERDDGDPENPLHFHLEASGHPIQKLVSNDNYLWGGGGSDVQKGGCGPGHQSYLYVEVSKVK